MAFKTYAKSAVTGKVIRPRLYRVWCEMRARCRNPKSHNWHRYGGRGIKVCEEWHDYANFREWSLWAGYRKGLSIDRVNNDGHYEPDNCRWITGSMNSSKLTPVQVREIRQAVGTTIALGKKYGVHPSYIGRIKSGEKRGDVV